MFLLFATAAGLLSGCYTDPAIYNYQTKHAIVIVVDGARYSECEGDSTHQLIPFEHQFFSANGVVGTHFYNNGDTYTVPGHIAISTGVYQSIPNDGSQIPGHASYMQYWLRLTGAAQTKAWVIASKDKLEVLSNCTEPTMHNLFRPSTDCGNAGLGTGYRADSTTFNNLLQTLQTHKPDHVFVNFKDPDYYGHQGNWQAYTQSILQCDQYIEQLVHFLETDPYYAGTTSLFITNDHGRHLDGLADGFQSHGDACMGCRHISFFAYGPDIRIAQYVSTPYQQIDIAATIARMFHLSMPYCQGQVMNDILK